MTGSTFKRFAIPTALVAGGVTVGSFVAPIDLVSADETDAGSVDSTTTSDSGDRDGHDCRRGPGLGARIEVLEEVLELSAEEIRAGMAEGKALADLAGEQGVTVDELADALVASATERIEQAVEDGKLDEGRAAELTENLDEMAERVVESEPFALGRGVGRAEGRGFARRHHLHDSSTVADDDGEVVDTSF